jgi:hypothetical protein
MNTQMETKLKYFDGHGRPSQLCYLIIYICRHGADSELPSHTQEFWVWFLPGYAPVHLNSIESIVIHLSDAKNYEFNTDIDSFNYFTYR